MRQLLEFTLVAAIAYVSFQLQLEFPAQRYLPAKKSNCSWNYIDKASRVN
jgi:hypothetical protein